MRNPETMLRVYEELADRFVAQHEPRFRDHCLVLAADAALAANRPDDAERLRQSLLQHNPHHLLRPFASMTEAMQAPDVQEYVADLRRQWPPEFVQKLYLGGRDMPLEPAPERVVAEPPAPERVVAERPAPMHTERGTTDVTMAPAPPAPPKPAKPAKRVEPAPMAAPRRPVVAQPVTPVRGGAAQSPPLPPVNPAAVWMATMLLLLGIAGAAGLVFVTFVWPLLD